MRTLSKMTSDSYSSISVIAVSAFIMLLFSANLAMAGGGGDDDKPPPEPCNAVLEVQNVNYGSSTYVIRNKPSWCDDDSYPLKYTGPASPSELCQMGFDYLIQNNIRQEQRHFPYEVHCHMYWPGDSSKGTQVCGGGIGRRFADCNYTDYPPPGWQITSRWMGY